MAGAGPVIVAVVPLATPRAEARSSGRNIVIMIVNLKTSKKVSYTYKETTNNKCTWAQTTSVVVWTLFNA